MMLQEYVAPSLGTSGVCGSGEDGRGGAGGPYQTDALETDY